MRRGVVREPRIPPDVRLVELAVEGIPAWYRLHVGENLSCSCNLMGADPECDVGHALHRLSTAARAGLLDRHKVSA